MLKSRKRDARLLHSARNQTAWRQYQFRLKQKEAKHKTLSRIPKYVLLFGLAILVIHGFFFLLNMTLFESRTDTAAVLPPIDRIDRATVRQLISPEMFINTTQSVIHRNLAGRAYKFNTTLDADLQASLLSVMDRRYAQEIAIVAIEPQSGAVIGMTCYDRESNNSNPCLSAKFPAASLFKMITAAAAIEAKGFDCNTKMAFNGGKYTLYKSQLAETRNKYTNYVTLEEAFAESVNPVFGKIGQHHLGKAILEKYAADFGFNSEIDFDLPVEPSVLQIEEKSYNWAEIACGFNNTTRISPLHGAMIAGAIVNNGRLAPPRIIDSVVIDNDVVYRHRNESFKRPIKPETARRMRPLMTATITAGTARKSFRGRNSRKIISQLNIGGKTGSINNNAEQIKYDWFAGFAEDKTTGRQIAVAVMVAHKDYIGTRAPEYFRRIISEYYEDTLLASGKSS